MTPGVSIMYACNQKVSSDGRRRVDLIDRFGNIVRNAYVMSGAGLPLNVPLEQETSPKEYTNYPQVVVGFMQGDPLPVVLGALDTPGVSYTRATETATDYDPDGFMGPKLTNKADADTDVNFRSMEEVVLAAPNGGRFILKRNGHAVIAGVGVSVQIPEGSYMRISAGGDTEGRVPLVDPLVERLNDMTDKINDLQDEVRTLRGLLSGGFELTTTTLVVVPPAGAGQPPTVAPIPTGITVLTAFIGAVATSTSTPVLPLDSLTIASATLRVSSATEV
jgi:hypothetical protein